MGSSLDKRTMVVAGNCQASFLYRALMESPQLTDQYDLVYFRNFRKGDQGVLRAEDMANCAVLIEQIAHKAADLPNRDLVPADCRVITFPILWMNSLWPTAVKDPRNAPTEQYPAGPYPYGDRFVLQLLDEGLTPEEAAVRYLETDLSQVVDLGRFHQINVDKARILDERADLPLGAHVIDNFLTSRSFVTQNHPTFPMLRYIADAVFDALGVEPPESDLQVASGGMDHIHTPIHPKVAEYFGLKWYQPDMEYRYHSERLRIGEFIRRYAAFE